MGDLVVKTRIIQGLHFYFLHENELQLFFSLFRILERIKHTRMKQINMPTT